MRIERRHPGDPALSELLAAAVADVAGRYPETGDEPYPVYPQARFLVALIDDVAVGCGAVQPVDACSAEIKRMYVRPQDRGQGVARRLLAALEREAAAAGWTTLLLETGTRQPEAIRLYESAGYRQIPAYGHYVGDPYSVCMAKRLAEVARAANSRKLWHDDRL